MKNHVYNNRAMEKELIIKAKSGDKAAFSNLMKIYGKRIYLSAYRYMGNMDDASDIVQDVMLKSYEALDRFNEEQSFGPWIFQITKNTCFNRLKRKEYKNSSLPDYDLKCSQTESPEEEYMKAETLKGIKLALNSIKEEFREILVLKYFQEYSYDDISEELNIPKGTVMSRLYHARKAVKTVLERGNYELSRSE